MQIRSLRQLILLCFLVALVPLAALLWQGQRDFDVMSQRTADNTAFFVFISSEVRQLEALGEDAERLVRQYRVLPNEQLEQLAQNALTEFNTKYSFLCGQFSDMNECGESHHSIDGLLQSATTNDEELNQKLAELRAIQDALVKGVQQLINQRISLQQTYLTEVRSRQEWSTLVLAAVSLVITLLATQLIIKPIRKLHAVIRSIANSEPKLPEKMRDGPRELVAVEKDLYWLNERLQQLEKVRAAMLRHAAHEIKTPMASIKEGCEILDKGMVGELSNEQKEIVGLLKVSTERLNLLTTQLLDYNALLQQAKPTFKTINLHEMAHQCANEYQLLLTQNEQSLVIEIPPKFELFSDPELLRRALDNLISNAIAHGNVNSEIVVRATALPTNTSIEVLNAGKPIAEQARLEVFEPFKRGSSARNDKVMGAGLGLSIVSDCARLLGGEVSIVDHEDMDVCFRINIPSSDAQVTMYH